MLPFSDRATAGHLLASKLGSYLGQEDVLVASLPRGGVPVGFEIARILGQPFDVIVVRKVGLPWRPDLALGAVSRGVRIVDHDVLRSVNLSNYYVYGLFERLEEEAERREALFREGHPPLSVRGKIVILVDDGAASGATLLAAAGAVRKQSPKELIIAVPVASHEAYTKLKSEVDQCFCLATPATSFNLSECYRQFSPVRDEEVRNLLARSRKTMRQDLANAQAAGA